MAKEFERPLPPLSTGDVVFPKPGVQGLPPGVADLRFVLREVVLEGNDVLSTAELARFYDRMIGQEVLLSGIFDLANRITEHYADAGYALAVAYVPTQEIEDGRVKIAIVEGRVAEVAPSGDAGSISGPIGVRAERIKASAPLTTSVLERQLLLLNDLPGITVKGILERSALSVGGTRLILNVDKDPMVVVGGFNNRGSKALGPGRFEGIVTFNDLTKLHARLSFNIVHSAGSDDLKHHGVSLTLPVATTDWTVDVNLSRTKSRPGTDDLRLLDFASAGTGGHIRLRYPIIRAREMNLSFSTTFSFHNSAGDFLTIAILKDRTRTLRTGVSFDWLDRLGAVSQLGVSIARGLDVFGATANDNPLKSRFASDFTFTKLEATAYRNQPLAYGFRAVLSARAQLGFDPMPLAEQCGYGGPTYGRGFDHFEFAGDHCLFLSSEIQKQFLNLAGFGQGFQAYGFWDIGKAWLKGIVFPGEEGRPWATSLGGGFRLRVLKHVNLSVEYAKPLERDVRLEGNRNGRVFFKARVIL